jgi:hypothetical protein
MKGPLTQISPLRCAPVEMTKGRAVLPGKVVAEQKPFSSLWVSRKQIDSSVENISMRGPLPQISPLRCASVEMTRGVRCFPGKWGPYRSRFSSLWVSRKQIDSSVENISMRGPLPQISPLRCASVEMTKGRAVLPGEVVAEQRPFFITLGARKQMTPLLKNISKKRPLNRRSLHFAPLRSILPLQNVSLSEAVLMRKGGKDDEVEAGPLHA